MERRRVALVLLSGLPVRLEDHAVPAAVLCLGGTVSAHTCFYTLVGVTWGWQLQSSQGPFVFAVQGAGVSKAHNEIRFQAIAAMLLRGGCGCIWVSRHSQMGRLAWQGASGMTRFAAPVAIRVWLLCEVKN